MRSPCVALACLVAAFGLVLSGCSQAAPPAPTAAPKAAAPTAAPTAAPAAPTKAPEPTKPAAAAQPTAAPAAKVTFPEKGKTMTMLVPFSAGGSSDISARAISSLMEKDLGIAIPVVNKAGAGGQIGLTELAQSKPDGYTIAGGTPLLNIISSYLDPERKAAYNRKSFEPVAMIVDDPVVMMVPANSPYKTLKDLVDAARAKPKTITVADTGVLSPPQTVTLLLEQAAGVKFAGVRFEGAAAELAALLGGNLDAGVITVASIQSPFKAGTIRLLGLSAKEESEFAPGVKTMESQGYKVYMGTGLSIVAPAGTPKAVLDVLTNSVKKAMESDEMKTRMKSLALKARFLDQAQLAEEWATMEKNVQPLVALSRE